MKQLSFYPFYEELLRSRTKTTTFRVGNHASLKRGDEVMLTVGWGDKERTDLHSAIIKNIYRRRICDLNEFDFQGESPDCKSPEATRLVLSCIYRRVLGPDDEVWVIKLEHK